MPLRDPPCLKALSFNTALCCTGEFDFSQSQDNNANVQAKSNGTFQGDGEAPARRKSVYPYSTSKATESQQYDACDGVVLLRIEGFNCVLQSCSSDSGWGGRYRATDASRTLSAPSSVE
jgi:hypothetical protein